MLINDEVQRQVLPVLVKATSVSASGNESDQRSSLAQLQLNPGQQVKAEIIAELPNHLYLARVAGELFKVELPVIVHPGQTMNLTFVSADPRVTFALNPGEGASSSVNVSTVGRWLASVTENAVPLPPSGPLVDSPWLGTGLLAAKLREAIVSSGLFYEAHLARWAQGSFPLAELLKEPQARLGRSAKSEPGAEGKGTQASDEAKGGAAAISGHAASLMKEQLLLLDTGILSWSGQAWPGQELDLKVLARDEEEEDGAVEATLALELPNLGGVRAKLTLTGAGVEIELVMSGDSTELIKEGAGELRAGLGNFGLQLTRLAVKSDADE